MNTPIIFRISTFILTLFLSVNAFGQKLYYQQRIASVSAGNKYVFVCGEYALLNSLNNSKLCSTTQYSSNRLTGNENFVWELESCNNNDEYYIKAASISGAACYLTNTSSTDLYFAEKGSATTWRLSRNKNVIFCIYTVSQGKLRVLSPFDNTSHEFKVYQQDTSYIFKVYELREVKTQTVSFSNLITKVNVGSTVNNTAKGKSTITYKSSDSNIASVDSVGTVHGISVGSATITATASATNVYYEASQTYTIDVVDPNNPRSHNITMSSGGLTTLFLNYATQIPEGTTAYYISTYDSNKDLLTATQLYNYVPAHTGIIIKGTASQKYTFNETQESVESVSDNKLEGQVTEYSAHTFTTEDGWYYLSVDGLFKKYEGEATKKPYKAYLYLPNRPWDPTKATKDLTIVFDDVTGTSFIQSSNDSYIQGSNDSYPDIKQAEYNLSGQPTTDTNIGIVIRNGKKYLKK